MSIHWERFAGDTARFAVKISFEADPHGGETADEDMGSSWGALQVWVDGVNVCAHQDGGETVQAVHWYMLPLLEWVADNWNPAFHEERLPTAASHAAAVSARWFQSPRWGETILTDERRNGHVWDWRQRHALRTARDGGILPNLFFRRYRSRVEVSWNDAPIAGAEDVTFLAPAGTSRLSPDAVAGPLYDVASEAARWLRSRSPHSPRLRAAAERLDGLPHRDHPQKVAWLAGLGWTGRDVLERWLRLKDQMSERSSRDAVERTFEPSLDSAGLVVQGSCAAGLLFSSTDPALIDEDVWNLAQRLLDSYTPAVASPLFDAGWDEPLAPDRPAWQQGYELADDLLDTVMGSLVPDDATRVDVERVLLSFGVDVREVSLSDQGIRAVSFATPDHKPTLLVNLNSSYSARPSARRFTLAHELCHLLFDRAEGADLAVASGPWAPRDLERRANAFAAAFLMPPRLVHSVESRVAEPLTSEDGVREAATMLGVSYGALVAHLYNTGVIDYPSATRLVPELEPLE